MRRDKSPCSISLHSAQHSIPNSTRVVNRKKLIQIFIASIVLMLLWRYYVRSTRVKELCTYVDDDLVSVAPGQQCAETQKIVPPSPPPQGPVLANLHIDVDLPATESATDEFDFSVCSPLSTLKVYVPKHDHPLAKALSLHPAATADQREACLDIEFADGGKKVYSRSRNNSNLLVINLDPSRTVTATGAVLLAQDDFGKGAFRPSLDFAVHTDVDDFDIDGWKSEPSILPASRQNFAAYLTAAPGSDNSSSAAIHTVSCSDENCDANLAHYSYCLISPSKHFQSHLLLALHHGCIPVILSRSQPLPFQDHLDWKLVALRFPNLSLGVLLKKLEMIPKEDILEMRRRGIIFRRRLDNAHALARTLLAAVAETMQLQLPAAPLSRTRPLFKSFESNGTYLEGTRKDYRRIASPLNMHERPTNEMYLYDRWNSGRDLTFTPRVLYDAVDLPAEAEYYADSEIVRTAGSRNRQVFGRGLGLNREPEQFTVVMMTYNRDDGVKEIIQRLNNCPHMNKMIIVWNNIGRMPKDDWPKIHVPIEFIRAERNSVNNRFLPFDRIETEAIFFIDDDMDVVHDELVYAFKVWRQNRDRIVGFFDRYHSWSGETSKYGKARSCEYSMMIGAFLVAHKEFFYEYSYNMHPAIRAMVDEVTNCDDLAFNYHVSHLTRKPPMKVQKLVGNWNSKTIRGLSARGNHFTVRDECMQKMNAIYGYNPLMLSQVKAMPSIGVCVHGMH